MPHFIVEYSDNLADEAEMPALLRKIADRLVESDGVFPPGGVRVRAYRAGEYAIADGSEDDAFVHATAKIGPGRSPEFKQRFFGEIFELIRTHFADLSARRYLALSLYVEEADEAGSFKQNNLHARFKP